MVFDPLQPGPCTLDEAVTLLRVLEEARKLGQLSPESPEGAARCLENLLPDLGRDRSLQSEIRRAMIRGVFEGSSTLPSLYNPFESLAVRYQDLPPETLRLGYAASWHAGGVGGIRPREPGGRIEALALYLPKAGFGERYGIYFHARRMLDAAASAGLPVDAAAPAVGVHELFHAFLDAEMPCPEHIGHDADPFCPWEEAAADRAVVDWARERNLAGDALMKHFFPTRAQGGLPGYGDWDRVLGDYPAVLPIVIQRGGCGKPLTHTDWILASGRLLQEEGTQGPQDILPHPQEGGFANLEHRLNLWEGMRSRFTRAGGRVVPVYVDLAPWSA